VSSIKDTFASLDPATFLLSSNVLRNIADQIRHYNKRGGRETLTQADRLVIQAALRARAPTSVLEVGVGYGYAAMEVLSSKAVKEYTGVDPIHTFFRLL